MADLSLDTPITPDRSTKLPSLDPAGNFEVDDILSLSTKSDIGLNQVDNTADASKPVSSAQQNALNAKADTSALSSHTGNTANPHSVTATQVGLGNVDNTADANKPVSSAQQTALDGKAAGTVIADYVAPTTATSSATHTFNCAGKSTYQIPDNATNTTITLENIADGQRVTVSGNNTVVGFSVAIAHATFTIYGDQTVITNETTNTHFSIDIERVGTNLLISQATFG